MKVLIVDDERLARQKLRRFLETEPDVAAIAECASGDEALARLAGERPDILFLDVQMPGTSGLDVLAAAGPDAARAIVFVTAHDEHALAAFEAAAVDYLLKPFDRPRFQRALARARRFAGAPGLAALVDRLPVRDGARTILVPLDDILWLEAQGNYVGVHTAGATHLLRDTLSALETRLDPARFLRVHRGAMVRLGAVAELVTLPHGDGVVRLTGGGEVPVGRTYRERVVAALRQSV